MKMDLWRKIFKASKIFEASLQHCTKLNIELVTSLLGLGCELFVSGQMYISVFPLKANVIELITYTFVVSIVKIDPITN